MDHQREIVKIDLSSDKKPKVYKIQLWYRRLAHLRYQNIAGNKKRRNKISKNNKVTQNNIAEDKVHSPITHNN